MSVAGNGAPASGATDDVPRDKQTAPSVMDGLSSSKVTGKLAIHGDDNRIKSYKLQSSTMTRQECFH